MNISDDWDLVNRNTGEIRPLITFTDEKRDRWEKVYAKSLCNMLEITGDEKTRVLAYMIRVKDSQNRIMETVRSLADATGVSKTTVQSTLKLLQEHNYIHKVRNGLWRFSPHVIRNGQHAMGMAVCRFWDKEQELNE